MQQGWLIAYVTIVFILAHGYAENLLVSIIPTRLDFNEKQNVEIILNYKNIGSDTVFIYDWYLPNEELMDPLFKVTRNGESVEYVGPLMKRMAPTAKEMITIKSGTDISTHVNLSSVYNMTETGNYTVQFKASANPMLLTTTRKRRSDGTPFIAVNQDILQSTPTSMFVVGRRNALIEKSTQINSEVKGATISYNGCSTTRKSSVMSGVQSAVNYASNAVRYLSTSRSSGTSRYTTWFGMFSSTNYNTLRSHFNNINRVLTSLSMRFDCTCTQSGIYAYVYKNQPYTIYLCPVYWNAPVSGTDSKGGTIIHELSHFTVVAGTDDNAYGQSACKNLAKSSPTRALDNGDSHEYFAENNPMLQ